jgi:hypothetical protein
MAAVMERPSQENSNRDQIGQMLLISLIEWETLPEVIQEVEEDADLGTTAAWIEDALEMVSRVSRLRKLYDGAELEGSQRPVFEALDVLFIARQPLLTDFLAQHGVVLHMVGNIPATS